MNFISFLLMIFFSVFQAFAADGWRVHSKPFPIYSVAKYGDGIICGTAGGVRIKNSAMDRLYTANNGLETSQILSVVAGVKGVFAISEYGMIASLKGNLNGWDVISRSYESNARKLIPDASRLEGEILVLVFEDRIAFFDVKKQKSILTITRIGDVSFTVYPPKVISIHGSELYVSTGEQVFKREMKWDSLWTDVSLIDPESWIKVKTEFPVYGMAWKGDSLKMYPSKGVWLWDGDVESHSVEDSSTILLRGNLLKNEDFYENGVSTIKWIFSYENKTNYLISYDYIVHFTDGNMDEVGDFKPYELGPVYEIVAMPDGGALAASPRGAFAYCDGEKWSELRYYNEMGYGNMTEAYSNRMKVLSILPDGYMMYHLWGEGFYLYSRWGVERLKHLSPSDGLCMDNYLTNYTVTAASIVAPDSSGFLTTSASKNGYSLIYISRDGEMSCLNQVGNSAFTGAISAKIAKNGVDWDVYVGMRTAASTASEGALDVYSISPPSLNGGRLINKSKKTVHGLDGETPVDFALDSKNGYLWMVSASKIGYFDLEQDTIRMPSSMSGLYGAEYTSLEMDPHNNLWVGTTNKGLYRLSRKGKSNDTLSTKHFTTRNGMLSNGINDISIQKEIGVIWVAHDQGVSWYKRNDLRSNESFMTDSALVDVIVYPNPYRPKIHKYVTIDFLAEDATVSIFNRGGALIKFYSNEDLYGGRIDWDGKDKTGKLVSPGVYYYVAKSSSKIKKGKFIIIH